MLGLFARTVVTVVVGVDDFVTLVLELLANLLETGADFLLVALYALDPISAQTLQRIAQAVFVVIRGILKLLVKILDLLVLFLGGCFRE